MRVASTRTRESWTWVYCAPALGLLSLVAFFPLMRTLYLSFTDAKLSTLDQPQWVGLENFRYLVQDPDWWHSVAVTSVFALSSVALETVLGLNVALLLNYPVMSPREARFRALLRALMLIPWAIPGVVSAKIWAWMFNDLYGVINAILLQVHLIDQPVSWLADDRLSILVLIIVDVWKTTPFIAIILLAGLQGIPRNLYEAAELEGVNAWQQFWKITLPLLRPALWIAVIFRTLDAFRVFDLPFVLTSNSRATAVMSVYARQHLLEFQEIGYGSSASFLIFALIATLSSLYLWLGRRELGLDS